MQMANAKKLNRRHFSYLLYDGVGEGGGFKTRDHSSGVSKGDNYKSV